MQRGGELDRETAATDASAAESKLQEVASGRPVPSAEIIGAKRRSATPTGALCAPPVWRLQL
jgi:hypothetical protein